MGQTAHGLSQAERIEIEHLCTRLSIDYSFFADSGRMDEWADLFADDAEMIVMGKASQGKAAIRAGVGAGGPSPMVSFHSVSNIRVEVQSATEAQGTVPVTVYMARKDGDVAIVDTITPAIVGTYFDTYRKTADGWRFARRDFRPSITRKT